MPLAYRRLTRTWTKPPLGSQIDWSHPLAQGLACAFLLNENGGPQVLDSVTRLVMPLTGSPAWSSGLETSAGSKFGKVACPGLLIQPPVTLIWQGRLLTTIDSFCQLCGIVDTGTTHRIIGFEQQGSTTVSASIRTNSGAGSLGAMTISTTNPTQLGAVYTNSGSNINGDLYRNGSGPQGGSGASTGTSLDYSGTPNILFNWINASFSANCSNDFLLLYSVAQSASNMQWLAAEPYDFILTPISTRYFFQAAGPVSSGGAALLMAM